MSILKNIENEYGEFSALRANICREKLGRFSRVQQEKLKKIFGDHDVFIGVEWIARHYLASKKYHWPHSTSHSHRPFKYKG